MNNLSASTLNVILTVLYLFSGWFILENILWMETFHTFYIGQLAFEVSLAFLIPFAFFSAGMCFIGALYPHTTLLRIAAFLAFLVCFDATDSNVIKITHALILWILVLAVLACTSRKYLESGIVAARVMILTTYLYAGLWKFAFLVSQCLPVAHTCVTHGASALFAERALEANSAGILTTFLVMHPALGFTGFVLTASMQVLVLFLYFNKRLGFFVPYALIAFHVLVYIGMGIPFFQDILLLFILFILPQYIPRLLDTQKNEDRGPLHLTSS